MAPITHPGRLLKRELNARSLSANRLALDLGVPSGRITDILNGRRGITADTAVRLGRYFGNRAQFWLDLQSQYEIALVERDHGAEIAQRVLPTDTGVSTIYQERLLLYADILGWSAEITRDDHSRLSQVIAAIRKYTTVHNERVRQQLRSAQESGLLQTDIGSIPIRSINPMALDIQFSAFSDHFVFSMPASFGSRILDTASSLMIDLLRQGFLIRGAVVLGQLHHLDNVIFGPSLIKAVEIENFEAFYPRILVHETVVDHLLTSLEEEHLATLIKDQTGRFVINPFAIPFRESDEMIESVAEQNFFFSQIKSIVDRTIANLESEGRFRHAEKWRYLNDFIAGPVLTATPQFERFWQ